MARLLLFAAICVGLLVLAPLSDASAQDAFVLPESPPLAQRSVEKQRGKTRSRAQRRRAAAKRKRATEARKSRDIAFYSLGVGLYLAAPVTVVGLSDDDLSLGRAVLHTSVLGPFGSALAVGGVATFFAETGGPSTSFLGNTFASNAIVGTIALASGIGIVVASVGVAEDLKGEDIPGGLVAINVLGALASGLGAGLISDSMDASSGATVVFAIGASALGLSLAHALGRDGQLKDRDGDSEKPIMLSTPLIIF